MSFSYVDSTRCIHPQGARVMGSTMAQEGGVDFPQLQCQVAFEPSEANARRAQLQDLACFAGIAVKFQEAGGMAELLVVVVTSVVVWWWWQWWWMGAVDKQWSHNRLFTFVHMREFNIV